MTTYIPTLLCICVCVCNITAQAYKKIDLQLSDQLIDLVSLEDDHVHLITSKGMYDFDILKASPLAFLKERTIRPTTQNYSSQDKSCFFPLKNGGYVSYNKNHKIVKVESGNLEDGILLETRHGHKWLANNSLYKNVGGKWKHKLNITSFSSLTDGKAYKDILWLSSNGEGVYRIDDELHTTHYDNKNGLYSNESTALHIIDENNVIVGHRGGISIVGPDEIELVNLEKELGKEPILEMEMDNAGKLWIITAHKLISFQEGKKNVVDVSLNEKENLVGIHLGSDQNIWLLSDKSVYIIPNTEVAAYSFPNSNKEGSILDFYQIRGTNYITDGGSVYSLNNKTNTWVVQPKKAAPTKVIHDSYGNPNLIFANNKGIKLNSKNAKVLNKLTVPESDQLNNIDLIKDRKYYSTKSHLYEVRSNELKLLSHKEDEFYKVIESNNGIFVFAKNGIYKILDEKIVPLLATYQNAVYPFSVNQFQIEDKLFTIKKNSIQIIETLDESIQEVPIRPLNILDIKVNGTLVWLFCSKSIVALDKGKLSKGIAEIIKVIPIYEHIDAGQLYKQSEEEIWAMGTDKLFRLNVNDPITSYTPHMQLYKVVDMEGEELKIDEDQTVNITDKDLPITITYNGTNFWTENISYAYHLNYDGKNTSEWRSENSYTMNNLGTGRYTLNAKFKDDIYGVNVEANKVVINVTAYQGNSLDGKKKWLPIIVISSLILCCLFFLTRKRS